MGEPVGGEDGNLLPPGDAVHAVDGRDPSLNHFLGVDARPWVDWLTCVSEHTAL